jgi:hypothetical protein
MEEFMTPKLFPVTRRFCKSATASSFIRLSAQQQNWVLLT